MLARQFLATLSHCHTKLCHNSSLPSHIMILFRNGKAASNVPKPMEWRLFYRVYIGSILSNKILKSLLSFRVLWIYPSWVRVTPPRVGYQLSSFELSQHQTSKRVPKIASRIIYSKSRIIDYYWQLGLSTGYKTMYYPNNEICTPTNFLNTAIHG